MFNRRALTTFLLLPTFAAANPGLIQVTSARAWSHPGSTRVVIQTTGAFQYRVDRATNPDRLFFDILGARPWIDGRRLAMRYIGDAQVKRIRVAETMPGTTRIVFDLEGLSEFTVTKLDTPNRLVVEIRRAETRRSASIAVTSTVAPAVVMPRSTAYRVTKPFIAPPPPFVPTPSIPMPVLMSAASYQAPSFYLPDPLRSMVVTPPRVSARKQRASTINASTSHASTTRVIPATRPVVLDAVPLASASSKSLTRALGLKINRVVIDAGHGGHDQGTMGPNGLMEKELVLDVSLRVAKLIQERLGAEVILTRSDDTFIPLHERTMIANEHKADLFLSIHANSSPSPQVAGTETFFLNFTNSPGALDVAARENAGSDKSVGELRDLIQSITLNDKIEESRTFAQEIERAISSNASRSNPSAKDRGIKRAPFVVLIGASMPSVLAEIGFLSNSRDERNLFKGEYRQKVAEALYRGVAQYSQSLSHFDISQKLSSDSHFAKSQ